MANRDFAPLSGSVKRGVVKLFGKFLTTTGGTLDTTAANFSSAKQAGFTLTKTAAKVGRYSVALQDKYRALLALQAVPNGAADTAYPIAKGTHSFPRNVSVAGSATANGTLDIQFARSDTMADAEVEDGATIYVELTLDNSSV